MTYNPNVPRATDRISDTQLPILTNFSQANTLMGTNHFEFNYGTAAYRGLHKNVTLPVLPIGGLYPVVEPTPLAGQGSIYARNVVTGAINQTIPFYRKDNTVIEFPVLPIRAMGRFDVTTGAAIGTPFNLACGPRAGSTVTLNFPLENMPDANYLVLVTQITSASVAPNTSIVLGTLTNATFQITFLPVGVDQISVVVLHYKV